MADGIAPWLQPAHPAQYLGQAFAEGAQIAHARSALMQQQEQEAASFELQQRQMEQRNRLAQQEIEMRKAYQESQKALAQQELAEKKQLNDLKVQEAAHRFQAQQAYQADIASGMDPVKAALKNSYMFTSPAAFAAAIRKSQTGAGEWKKGPTGQDYYLGPDGKPYFPKATEAPEKKAELATAQHEYNVLTTKKFDLEKEYLAAGEKDKPRIQDQITRYTRRQRALQEELGMIPRGTTAAPPAAAPGAGAASNISIIRDPKTGKLVVSQATPTLSGGGPGSVTFGSPAAQPAMAGAPPPPPAAAGLSIGGMPIGPAPAAAAPQATIPASMAPPPAPSRPSQEEILDAYRQGEISKTDAQKAIGRFIEGREWAQSDRPKKTWHMKMKKDDSGNYTHWYTDYPE